MATPRPARERAAGTGGRRRPLLRAALAVVAVTATVTATVTVVRHYASAAPLSAHGGGYGWFPPDSGSTTQTRVGPYDGLSVPARPGASQSFYFWLTNDSGVTQTVLGLAGAPHDQGDDRETLTASTTNDYRLAEPDLTYVGGPVVVRPHDHRVVRYTFRNRPCVAGDGYTRYWDSVVLRVRVGAFTRTETVPLGGVVFEVTQPKDCPAS